MTIEEAIRIKLAWRKENYPPALPDEMNADMLSIKALKLLLELRSTDLRWFDPLLPGETKD